MVDKLIGGTKSQIGEWEMYADTNRLATLILLSTSLKISNMVSTLIICDPWECYTTQARSAFYPMCTTSSFHFPFMSQTIPRSGQQNIGFIVWFVSKTGETQLGGTSPKKV